MTKFGNILAVANPAAHNGAGRELAVKAEALLRKYQSDISLDMVYTDKPGHATDFAATSAARYDTLLVLGGDGLVHEVVNGLMALDASSRPQLGVLPLGSGNDYVNALGLPLKIEDAVPALIGSQAQSTDVGLVNGVYYAETLSFGLDAAIALETMELRKQTNWSGTKLYFHAGIDQLLHHLDEHSYTMSFVNEEGCTCESAGTSIVFAVQVGATYGGGFRICPDACFNDGLLDMCIAHPPVSVPRAVYVFVRAKDGNHTHMKPIEMLRASKLHIEFEHMPPVQVDGEPLESTTFDIECLPGALSVLRK